MVDADKFRFATAIGALCLAFNREASPELVRVYWMALNDLPIEAVEKAVHIANREVKGFMPEPARIRDIAKSEKPIRQLAIEAWQLVMDHGKGHIIRKGPVDFGSLVNAAVRAVGGIDRFASGQTSDLENFVRPRFIEAYEFLSRCDKSELKGRPLVGDGADGKPIQLIGVSTPSIGFDSQASDLALSVAKSMKVKGGA